MARKPAATTKPEETVKPVAKAKPAAPAEAAATQVGKLVFDGVDYALDQLSEEARAQVGNVRATEQEISRLRIQIAIAQTAHTAYVDALKKALPQQKS